MNEVGAIENSANERDELLQPVHNSSFFPYQHPSMAGPGTQHTNQCYLPCHYFDFMIGTSTGGYVQIR